MIPDSIPYFISDTVSLEFRPIMIIAPKYNMYNFCVFIKRLKFMTKQIKISRQIEEGKYFSKSCNRLKIVFGRTKFSVDLLFLRQPSNAIVSSFDTIS